jgi:hypothetical protein
MNIDNTSLAIIFSLIAVGAIVRYFLLRKIGKSFSKNDETNHEFLTAFKSMFFDDFSSLSFRSSQESLIEPFPVKEDGGWKYTICLSLQDTEDLVTITHEITEFTVGRPIERLLHLGKPLYLERKEDRFWIRSNEGKYVLEHVVTTLSEVGYVETEKLKGKFLGNDFEKLIG